MQYHRHLSRSVVLTLSLLCGCAAAGPSETAGAIPDSGVYGLYLSGRFAASQTDLDQAARDLLAVHADRPQNSEVLQLTFLTCLMAGRPEASSLALQLPDNPAAQLLLGDNDALAGNWDGAEERFHAMSRQGLAELLQPLLVAWAQQGGGHTDAALATLAPFMDGPRFRGVYALHAALIADLGNHQVDAAKLYRAAQGEYGGLNMRLAVILASWEFRQNQPAEAAQTLKALGDASSDLAMVVPGLVSGAGQRPVANAVDGIAEAYLALAAALRQQDAADSALLLLQLALGMRPDFTPARLLMADILDSGRHTANALRVLAPVGATDALLPLVQLRRAALQEQLGNTEAAMRILDDLARDFPEQPTPLAQLGDILRARSRFAEAAAVYDRAIARIPTPGPNDWPLFYDRGIALERSKQWPKAEADFEHALQLAPDQPYVLNYLGYSWAEQGRNLGRAHQMIERALQIRPNDGSIIDSLGWVQLRQGETSDAVQQLEHAVELEPEDSTINGHLGDAYWAAGRHLEAEFQWRRALTLNPDPADIPSLQSKLHEAETASSTPASAERRVQ
jgi:tetratricopeptide (TPR) repeat protein